MKFKPPLQRATFIKRYKRFFADVKFSDGSVSAIHCPNTGSMLNCLVPNSPCWVSKSDNPKRKLAFTWEIATVPGRKKAGVNTHRANHLVVEAIKNDKVPALSGYRELNTEVPYGKKKSRIDIILQGHPRYGDTACYVEVKNVTYAEKSGRGLFPDAVSERGAKHLGELAAMANAGHRAVLFYCVQHSGIDWVEVAEEIDPQYALAFHEATNAGVEVIAYRAKLSAREIVLDQAIPIKNNKTGSYSKIA